MLAECPYYRAHILDLAANRKPKSCRCLLSISSPHFRQRMLLRMMISSRIAASQHVLGGRDAYFGERVHHARQPGLAAPCGKQGTDRRGRWIAHGVVCQLAVRHGFALCDQPYPQTRKRRMSTIPTFTDADRDDEFERESVNIAASPEDARAL